ncbi:MAG: hypothetical protein WEC75_14800 [Dehalococcoidia bacterium]
MNKRFGAQSGRSLLSSSVSISAIVSAVAGILLLTVSAASAHHNQVTEAADCTGWLSRGDYIGGGADRKVVVDVVINGEVIQQTFFFDNGPGHLGHQDEWELFHRDGEGPVDTSGTVKMYAKQNGQYTQLVDSDTLNLHFNDDSCHPTATPEPTQTHTPQPTSTNTPLPTSTNTAQPTGTHTPISTSTKTAEPTSTHTAQATSTKTAEVTRTRTAVSTATKTKTKTATTVPATTVPPTQTPQSAVEGVQQPPAPPVSETLALPSAGDGSGSGSARTTAGFALLAAAFGLAVIEMGLRRRAQD